MEYKNAGGLDKRADRKAQRRRHSQGEVARSKSRSHDRHMRLLNELDSLVLAESCCDICHCDCFSSHRSSNVSFRAPTPPLVEQEPKSLKARLKKSKTSRHGDGAKTPRRSSVKRSKSVTDLAEPPRHSSRDCAILQDVFTSLPAVTTPRLVITNSTLKDVALIDHIHPSPVSPPPISTEELDAMKLCDSMAELCLEPRVREAFQQVPTHDKKILNRMAYKRSESRVAKENAWLARKYWENERFDRELLKCEQVAEYRRAIRDKQFQDYLLTRARLRELEQRDREQLQRLRGELLAKEQRSSVRLAATRLERDLLQCQRRCEELRKAEAVNVQQEELQLDEACRKQRECQRLGERMRRADEIREHLLGVHMRRLRHNNYVEQLMHEEHWRETQDNEVRKIAQLRDHIRQKCTKTKRFMESRQRRQAVVTQTAKISASLRELVRSSLTPEALSKL